MKKRNRTRSGKSVVGDKHDFKAPQETKAPPALKITSLREFQEIVEKPMVCRLSIGGQEVEVPVCRLSPEVEDLINVERNRPVPPKVAPKRPGEVEGYDREAPDYLKAKERAERIARAMYVYFGCPWIRAEKPDLKGAEEILAFVQGGGGTKGILTNMVIEVLYMTIMGEGLAMDNRRAIEKANFTIAPE